MIRKFSKVFGVALCILAINSPNKAASVSAKYYNITRIYGESRYETSANISKAFDSKEVKSVIITNGNFFPDALAGSVLSKKINAPILLTSNGTSYEDWPVEGYISDHLAKDGTIYILGGEASVGTSFINHLRKLGYKNFKILGGIDRFETNIAIVDKMNVRAGTPVVIVNGLDFPDALSISSIAASKGYPILMSEPNVLPQEILKKLSSIKPSKIYMIGGTASLSDNISSQLKNTLNYINGEDIVRISGKDRYETSVKACSYFNLDSQSVVMANGLNFPDALSGSALAAKLNAPVVLTDGKNINKQKNYIDSTNYNNVIILGGEGAISSSAVNNFHGTKLNLGVNFPEHSENKIIDFKTADINGDNYVENIILTRSSNNVAKLFIQDSRTGEVIDSKAFMDYTSNYGEIILADVNGDKTNEIISLMETGGSGAMQLCDIETFRDNCLSKIGEWNSVENTFPLTDDDFGFSLYEWDNLNIYSGTFNEVYSIDLSNDEAVKEAKLNGNRLEPYVGHGPRFFVCDIDGDGVYELKINEDISGAYHADVLAGFHTYYKFQDSSWKFVKFDVWSDYPITEG